MFLHALSDGLLVSHPRTKKHSHATSEVKLMIMRHTNLVRAEEDDSKACLVNLHHCEWCDRHEVFEGVRHPQQTKKTERKKKVENA